MEMPFKRDKIEQGKIFACNECHKLVDSTNGCKISPSKQVSYALPQDSTKQIYICVDCYKKKLVGLKSFLLNNFITNKEAKG